MDYACFIKYQVQGWQHVGILNNKTDRNKFVKAAIELITEPTGIGDPPIDYKVVELEW